MVYKHREFTFSLLADKEKSSPAPMRGDKKAICSYRSLVRFYLSRYFVTGWVHLMLHITIQYLRYLPALSGAFASTGANKLLLRFVISRSAVQVRSPAPGEKARKPVFIRVSGLFWAFGHIPYLVYDRLLCMWFCVAPRVSEEPPFH